LGYSLPVPATLRDFFAVDVQSRDPIDILLPPVFLSWIVDVDDLKFEIALQTKVQMYVTVSVNRHNHNQRRDAVLTVCLIFVSSALATCHMIRTQWNVDKTGWTYVAKRTI